MIVSTFVFLIPTEPIWEAVAIASFFAWFKVILHLHLFDFFGIYVAMFLTITRTVFRVLLMAFLLIAAFALSLYILARTVPEFSTAGYSLFTTFSYMLGGDPYELLIDQTQAGNLQYSVLTFMTVITLAEYCHGKPTDWSGCR